MKSILRTALLPLVFAALAAPALLSLPAMAEEAGKPSIAVIDIKKITEESDAAKGITKEIEKKRDEFQKEVSKQEDSLHKEDQELSKQRSVLAKDAFEKKAKEFRAKVVDAQKLVQSRRAQLENAYVKAMSKVRDTTLEIIKGLAKERGFAVAIPKSQVLYNGDELDITEDVMKALNKQLPKVDVTVEKP